MMRIEFFFFKQKTAYEMRISDWSSDVCSSDLSSRSGGVSALPVWARCNCRARSGACNAASSSALSKASALLSLPPCPIRTVRGRWAPCDGVADRMTPISNEEIHAGQLAVLLMTCLRIDGCAERTDHGFQLLPAHRRQIAAVGDGFALLGTRPTVEQPGDG